MRRKVGKQLRHSREGGGSEEAETEGAVSDEEEELELLRSNRAASGFRCVTAREGGRYRAEACVGPYDVRTGKIPKKSLGHFGTAEEAARAVARYIQEGNTKAKKDGGVGGGGRGRGEGRGGGGEEEKKKEGGRRWGGRRREKEGGKGEGKEGQGEGGEGTGGGGADLERGGGEGVGRSGLRFGSESPFSDPRTAPLFHTAGTRVWRGMSSVGVPI